MVAEKVGIAIALDLVGTVLLVEEACPLPQGLYKIVFTSHYKAGCKEVLALAH